MNYCRARACSALALLVCVPLLSQTQEMIARQFVDLLAKRDFARAVEYFDDSTKGLVSASQIEAAWKAVTTQLGPFSKQLGVRTEAMASVDLVYVDCQFEKKTTHHTETRWPFPRGSAGAWLWSQRQG
jgi:SUMO ligase MMS21 Smc5/6 complex component